MKRLALGFIATGFLGAALVVAGIALVYPPAAVVLAGVALLFVAAFGLSRDIGTAG